MKKVILSLAGILMSFCAMAQDVALVGQDAYSALFRQSVKSCDEFMCRFNEEEYFPGLDISDPQVGFKNFMLLFDYKLSEAKSKDEFLKEISDLYDAIRKNNIKLEYKSKDWYAELRTTFMYKKNSVELGLVFKTEETPKGLSCWTIAGVNGLEKIGFKDSTNRMVISPEQHEADFMELDGDFKFSANNFSQFRSYHAKLDALSYFFALVESGALLFDSRVSTQFHFYDVPSYVFSIKYHERKKSNTGWLITAYKKVNSKEKTNMLNKLLSK